MSSLLADGMNHLLKALHTAEEFWSHSDFVAKELNESPLAETDTMGDVRTAASRGIFPKFIHGERHCRVMLEWVVGNSEQPALQCPEFLFDRWRFVQQAKQPAGAPFTPQFGKSDVFVVKLRV